MKFFPFIFCLFFFILFANLIGMNPYAFTTTSHLAVTVALAVFTIGVVIVAGIWINGLKWFKIFAPAGLPFLMYFIIVPIEIISFLARPITLANPWHYGDCRPRIPCRSLAGLCVCDFDMCLPQ